MKIPLPEAVARQISDRAVSKAREDMYQRGWTSMKAVLPLSGEGLIGLRTTLKFLMYQDQGTKPRVMKELEGKVIPMRDSSGLHFVRAKGVGQPGYVTLPGGVKVWRAEKWKHPGIKPKYFFENALSSAIKESRGLIQQSIMKSLVGEKI